MTVEILNLLIAMALVGGGWMLTTRLLQASLRAHEVRNQLPCTCGYPHAPHARWANRPALAPPAVRGPASLLNAAGFRTDAQ